MKHSGFGPCCNPDILNLFPNAPLSLNYFLHNKKGSLAEWFKLRLQACRVWADLLRANPKQAGMCVCCEFIMTDALLNGLYNIQVPPQCDCMLGVCDP